MPQRNTIKQYIDNGYYHIYNRGVNKQNIFQDEQDYGVLLSYLKATLSPPPKPDQITRVPVNVKGVSFNRVERQPKNHHGKIELVAYCLMPNHFHLLVKQKSKNEMESFMRSIFTRYSMYFNKKYKRIGPLFQGTYKAVLIRNDIFLLHLSRYIHLNPSEYSKDFLNAYSSYANYLGLKNTPWVKLDTILKFFNQSVIPELKKVNTYKKFVEKYKKEASEILGNLTLE